MSEPRLGPKPSPFFPLHTTYNKKPPSLEDKLGTWTEAWLWKLRGGGTDRTWRLDCGGGSEGQEEASVAPRVRVRLAGERDAVYKHR